MPELPEVETIRRELTPVVGRRITGVEVLRPDMVFPSKKMIKKNLKGRKINDIKRRGKYLIFIIEDGLNLIFHLRLSGRIIISKTHRLRYDRLIIKFSDTFLHFAEPRALGRAYLIREGERPEELGGFFRLGPEPLSKTFTIKYLKGILEKRTAKIKSLLLDQSLIAGLGNIYSDEALFLARVSPLRSGASLSDEEIRNLYQGIRQVIRLGVEYLGTSVSDYRRPDGRTGSFQKLLMVYRREEKPCLICGNRIKRIKVGNRSWRYCPHCQK